MPFRVENGPYMANQNCKIQLKITGKVLIKKIFATNFRSFSDLIYVWNPQKHKNNGIQLSKSIHTVRLFSEKGNEEG